MAAIASQIDFRFLVWPFRHLRSPRLLAYQISPESDHPRHNYDVIAIFKMAAVSHVGFDLGYWYHTHEVQVVVSALS